MTSRTDMTVRITIEAKERGNLVAGSYNSPRRAYKDEWEARYNALPTNVSMGDATYYNDDSTRRTAIIFDADLGGSWGGKLYTANAGDHSWDGGQPPDQIDLEDYDYGVFADAHLTEEALARAACFTGVIVPPSLTLDPTGGSPTGPSYFVSGELGQDLLEWPGRVQTG